MIRRILVLLAVGACGMGARADVSAARLEILQPEGGDVKVQLDRKSVV